MKRIQELSDLYEYRWGKEPDILAMPSTIDQRQLADVLERIVDTGESVMVGYDLCYNGEAYSDILKQLKPNPRVPFVNCHVDPDIRDNNRKTAIAGWKPAFGQCEAAQGLL